MVFKETGKINKQVIDTIVTIEKTKGLTAQALVEEAEQRDSPIHDFFEWDNSKAGEEWRLQQARALINEVKVIIDQKEFFAFENVSVGENDEKQRVYKSIEEIGSNETLRKQVIKSALERQDYWAKQYGIYEELTPIVKTISKVKKSLEYKWQNKKQK